MPKSLPTEGKFQRFWPFRVGMVLLYGQVPGLQRVTDTRILLQTGEFAAHLGLDSQKLKRYLQDLEDLMLLDDLDVRHGHCILTLAVPNCWKEKLQNEYYSAPEERQS